MIGPKNLRGLLQSVQFFELQPEGKPTGPSVMCVLLGNGSFEKKAFLIQSQIDLESKILLFPFR